MPLAGPPAPATEPPPPGDPLAPPRSAEEVDLDLKLQLEGLEQRVRARRVRSLWLGNGTLFALIAGGVCWLIYYFSSVYSYAALDPDQLQLQRNLADADRLAVVYCPQSTGRVGFIRTGTERDIELLDRVMSDQVGQSQRLEWRLGGLKTGDQIEVTYRAGLWLESRKLPVPRPPEAPLLGEGVLAGTIVSAIDQRPLPDAEIRVVGTRLATRTDRNGRFRLQRAPTGKVPIEVSAPGFSTRQLERTLDGSSATPIRVTMNPGMEAGRIRILLSWKDTALDLDAHLMGPLPDGQEFHVYYHEMGDLRSRAFVELEADADEEGGPEIVSVLGVLPGTYRYFVHDYTNRESPGSTALGGSGAEVVVQQGGQTYRFDAAEDRPGNVWNVFTIEVTPDGAQVTKVDTYQGMKAEALGLYAKRTRADRGKWVSRYGGSRDTENAVEAGLDWLARHQADDGSWGNYSLGATDPRSRCTKDGPACTLPGDRYEMAQTGLTLLAFQAAGHYDYNDNEYSRAVRRGLDWMIAHQQPDGALISANPLGGGHSLGYHKYYMYDHGIATFALAEACAVAVNEGRDPEPRYREAMQRAVAYIESQQHTDGSWKYNDKLDEPGDSSIAGWQVLALKSAQQAGIEPSDKCIAGIRRFFRHMDIGEDGRTWYERRPQPLAPLFRTEATTAIGMLARQFLLDEPDSPMVRDASAYMARYATEQWGDHETDQRDFYLWYNGTLAMYQAGGKHWSQWNAAVRDTIRPLQRVDGCARGSWDPASTWGSFGGRVYSTALAVLTLEVYYRYAGRGETTDWFEANVAQP